MNPGISPNSQYPNAAYPQTATPAAASNNMLRDANGRQVEVSGPYSASDLLFRQNQASFASVAQTPLTAQDPPSMYASSSLDPENPLVQKLQLQQEREANIAKALEAAHSLQTGGYNKVQGTPGPSPLLDPTLTPEDRTLIVQGQKNLQDTLDTLSQAHAQSLQSKGLVPAPSQISPETATVLMQNFGVSPDQIVQAQRIGLSQGDLMVIVGQSFIPKDHPAQGFMNKETVGQLILMGIPPNMIEEAMKSEISPEQLVTAWQKQQGINTAGTAGLAAGGTANPAMALAAQVQQENQATQQNLEQAGQQLTDAQQKAKDDEKKSESPGWFKALTLGAATAASFIPVVGSGAAAVIGAGGSVLEQQGFMSEKGWDPSRKVNYWQAGAIGAVSMIPGGGIMGKTGVSVAQKVLGKKITDFAVPGAATAFEKVAFNAVQHATTGSIAGATGGALTEVGRQYGTGDFNLLKVGESAIIGGATGGLTAGVLGAGRTGIDLKRGINPIAKEANQAYGTIASRKKQWGGNWVALPAERALERSGRTLGVAGNKIGETVGGMGQRIRSLRTPAAQSAPTTPTNVSTLPNATPEVTLPSVLTPKPNNSASSPGYSVLPATNQPTQTFRSGPPLVSAADEVSSTATSTIPSSTTQKVNFRRLRNLGRRLTGKELIPPPPPKPSQA